MTAGSASPSAVKKRGDITPVLSSKGGDAAPRGGSGHPAPPPDEEPSFTVADIRAVIPKHCFERNTFTSLRHAATDLVMAAAIMFAGTYISGLSLWLQFIVWPVYWYSCGTVLTGVWVVAHECGHGAFSPSAFVNDTVGWVLHSALLVPYFSWKYTHASHHRHTNSIDDDEVFVPITRSRVTQEILFDTPFANVVGVLGMLLFGWPGYVIFNITGPAKYANAASKSHFVPASVLFMDRQRLWVAVSDCGILLAFAALAWACAAFGVANVALLYGVPYLVVNAHLVLITFLQHTDVYIPHLRGAAFSWLRGALCTVDRTYGWPLDAAFHHITDTHVVHHLFHEMPWYHAQEATVHVSKLLGAHYLRDPTPVPAAALRAWSSCKFIEDEGDRVFARGAAAFADKKAA